ncbi:uncharacterized protein LOC143277481 [Babylonia areolata]|uniref:uncharacterized protein LOC143277481 n=1 Tax=Babylonia areolata TaxID=304850 RepID=UPI003FD352AA
MMGGHHHHHPRPTTPAAPAHPMSPLLKVASFRSMVGQQARQSGDLAYYQQHGCVDPAPRALPSCSSGAAHSICGAAGRLSGGGEGGGLMGHMISLLDPALGRSLEKCLTPKVMTDMVMTGMGGGGGGMNPLMMMAMGGGAEGGGGAMLPLMMMMMNTNRQTSGPTVDPHGLLHSQAARIHPGSARDPNSAVSGILGGGGVGTSASPSSLPPSGAAGGHGGAPVDCSILMPLLMSKAMGSGEGPLSPEALESVGVLRGRYLPFTCQEVQLTFTRLPYRLCCPGSVDPPTPMDLFKAQSSSGA